MVDLLIATSNPGKLKEFSKLLSPLVGKINPRLLSEFPNIQSVPETGNTFLENAKLKAQGYSSQTGLICLADDSGLSVDALGGEPGVLSARYAGESSNADQNNAKLVSEVLNLGSPPFPAQFICALCVFFPDGTSVTAEGKVLGEVITEPRGTHGFGYDAYFQLPSLKKTFAELTLEEKHTSSHRAKAFELLLPKLPF